MQKDEGAKPAKAQKLYFDSKKAEELVIDMQVLRKSIGYNKPSSVLCYMVMELADGLLRKSSYKNYGAELKEDMKSRALLDFCKYGHNYNASKSRSANACFSFLTFCFENSFKAILRSHYKQVNIDAVCISVGEMYDEYYQMQIDNDERDAESVDSIED